MSADTVVVGIDLGTTNSAIGVVDAGIPILLADFEGRRLVPSAVDFVAEGQVVVGHEALRRRAMGTVVTSAKRLMGVRGDAGMISLGEKREVGAEEVATEVLKALKQIAENRLEHSVNRAVITVPAYFNDAQRAATRRAGEAAGFVVERLVAEPTAAALSYGLSRLGESSRVAVYDLGGGTFDVSVLELREGVFEVLATAGDTRLGGDDFDNALESLMLRAVGWAERSLTTEQVARFREEVIRVKHMLSEHEAVAFEVPFFEGNESLTGSVSREEFQQVIASDLEKTAKLCRRVLGDAQIEATELDAVVLVGGSTRIPAVQELVERFFGKKPDLSQHPDEAIALGASIQAGILCGAYQNLLLLDVTPLSLGIETVGGLMNVLIPRNTTIPCKAGEMFTNAQAGQAEMRVRVLQGERELAKDNWELGKFNVRFQAAARGQARVGVQFSLNADGILEVLARDTSTGEDTILEIESAAVDVDDEEVEKMVNESVEHAFEDMSARHFAEVRMKAEELLPAVEVAMEAGGQFLSDEERKVLMSAKEEVVQAIDEEDVATLKAKVESLDQLTEELAAHLVEEAMQQHLLEKMAASEE